MLTRLRQAVAAGRSAAAMPAKSISSGASMPGGSSLRDKVHWALIHLDDNVPPGAGLADHESFCRETGFRCLVLSNLFDPLILSRPGVIFEFAPLDIRSGLDTGADGRLAGHYLLERMQLATGFWKTVGATWSGNRAAEVRRLAEEHAPALAALGGSGKHSLSRTRNR